MSSLKEEKKFLVNLLFEQEEEGDEEEKGEESTEEEAEEGDELVDVVEDNIDADIEAVLIDYESEARKKASEAVDESVKMIYEADQEIDINIFAGEVARLIKNYDNLIDMEKMLADKAKAFITSRYGEQTAQELEDALEDQHDIEIEKTNNPLETDLDTPLAVGATAGGEQKSY